jgi:hypothetical protein
MDDTVSNALLLHSNKRCVTQLVDDVEETPLPASKKQATGLRPSSHQLSQEDESKLGLGTAWIHQLQMARVGHFDAMEKKAEADSAIENLRAQPEVRSLLVGRSSACEGTTMPELMLLLFGPQTATPIFYSEADDGSVQYSFDDAGPVTANTLLQVLHCVLRDFPILHAKHKLTLPSTFIDALFGVDVSQGKSISLHQLRWRLTQVENAFRLDKNSPNEFSLEHFSAWKLPPAPESCQKTLLDISRRYGPSFSLLMKKPLDRTCNIYLPPHKPPPVSASLPYKHLPILNHKELNGPAGGLHGDIHSAHNFLSNAFVHQLCHAQFPGLLWIRRGGDKHRLISFAAVQLGWLYQLGSGPSLSLFQSRGMSVAEHWFLQMGNAIRKNYHDFMRRKCLEDFPNKADSMWPDKFIPDDSCHGNIGHPKAMVYQQHNDSGKSVY